MKCPKMIKNCQSCMIVKGKQGNFICSGICITPTKFHKDNIWLCSRGMLSKFNLEMTVKEALFICSALYSALAFLAPGVLDKEIRRRNKNGK